MDDTIETDILRHPEAVFLPNPENASTESKGTDDTMEILRQAKVKLNGNDVDIQIEAVELAKEIFLRYYHLFEKGKVKGCTPDAAVLNLGVIRMLSSCLELDFDDEAEIESMDREAYMIFRNLVEQCEMRKMKSEFFWDHLFYLEKEYQLLMESWHRFLEKSRAVLKWQKNTQKIVRLLPLRDFVGKIVNSKIEGNQLISAAQDAYTLLNEYKRSIPASIMQYHSLTPLMVAKSANLLIGVPISWPLNSFQPPLDCLEERLRRKVVGHDPAIKRIADIISRPRPCQGTCSPLASFIFLPASTIRLTEFFESLAEVLYDSKDCLIQFNLDMSSNGSCSSDVDLRERMNAVRLKVLEVVKNTPFCAILFENVNSCEFATDFLESMLTSGLEDDEGTTYELSNTLIMMTYTVGAKVLNALSCKCLEAGGAVMRTMLYNECDKLPLHREALKTLGHIHLLVDDVVVLDSLLPHREVITRIQLREVVDASWRSHQLILYPSEAVVQILADCTRGLGEKDFLGKWLMQKVLPGIHHELNGKLADDMTAVHIDILATSRILCYRSLEFDSVLGVFKESLKQWRTVYLTEKKRAREVVRLCTGCSGFLSLIKNTNEPDLLMFWFKDVADVLDDIISNAVNSNDFLSEQDLVPPNIIAADIANWPADHSDSNKMKCFRIKSPMILEEKYCVTDYIIESIYSNGFENKLQPKLFLCLGLSDTGKADLLAALNECVRSRNVGESITQMNMEDYSGSDSLMQFLDHVSALVRQGSSGKDLMPSKRKRSLSSPGHIFLIDRVGEAHASVFNAFLSMLDQGSLKSRGGESVDFCKAAVIVMSDLGSKEILARVAQNANGANVMEANADERREKPFQPELLNQLVRGPLKISEGESVDCYKAAAKAAVSILSDFRRKKFLAMLARNANSASITEANADKRREKPFRSELLNRLDGVLMFDPLLENQLQKFFSLQVGPEVASRLPFLLSTLFTELDHLCVGRRRMAVEIALRSLCTA